MSYEIDTRCIHLEGDDHKANYGAVSFPIYQTASFTHEEVGADTGYAYTRAGNPTRERLEKIIAQLEGGADALAFTSGMAAIGTAMELFKPGDHILSEVNLYGGSTRIFTKINAKNGVEFTFADMSTADVESLIKPGTKAVYLETPTNPLMNVVDIAAVAAITKRRGILLIVDNTFLSPYLQNPIALGADLVVHSGTKYIAGHNDTLSGFLVPATDSLAEELRYLQKSIGGSLAPFDSFLVQRGLKTLALRMEKSQASAGKIAEWLDADPRIDRVYYPGLASHPGYEVMSRQARGFGAMLSFAARTKEQALEILKRVKLIQFAESLGGTESLLTYPVTQTHREVDPEELARLGVTDRLLRLSVGIENAADLIADLDQALG